MYPLYEVTEFKSDKVVFIKRPEANNGGIQILKRPLLKSAE